jgi:hypothetical protein
MGLRVVVVVQEHRLPRPVLMVALVVRVRSSTPHTDQVLAPAVAEAAASAAPALEGMGVMAVFTEAVAVAAAGMEVPAQGATAAQVRRASSSSPILRAAAESLVF